MLACFVIFTLKVSNEDTKKTSMYTAWCTMSWTRVHPNCSRSIKLRVAQRSPEILLGAQTFVYQKTIIFPALVNIWFNFVALKQLIYWTAQYFSQLYYTEETAKMEPACQSGFLEHQLLQYSYINSLGKTVHVHKSFPRFVNNINVECLFSQRT